MDTNKTSGSYSSLHLSQNGPMENTGLPGLLGTHVLASDVIPGISKNPRNNLEGQPNPEPEGGAVVPPTTVPKSTGSKEPLFQPPAPTSNPRKTLMAAIAKLIFGVVIAGGIPKLVCELLHCDQPFQNIILISFALAALAFSLREGIQKFVPSVFLTILLIFTVAALAFITELRQEFLEVYPKTSNALGEVSRRLHSARTDVTFLGTNFYMSVVQDRDTFLEKLNQGVNVKIFVFDPEPASGHIIAAQVGVSPEVFQGQTDESLVALVDLQKRWNTQRPLSHRPGTLDIRIFSDVPRTRVYMFDEAQPNGVTLIVTYFNTMNAVEMPVLEVKNKQGGYYEKYRDGLHQMQFRSVPLEDWLKLHRADLFHYLTGS